MTLIAPDPRTLESAACLHVDPELFFAAGQWAHQPEHAEEAKAVCRTCPIVQECLAWAIATGDRWAVLGGTTPAERDPMLGVTDTGACGTYPLGYNRHRRRKEQPCDACRIACNEYHTRRRHALAAAAAS